MRFKGVAPGPILTRSALRPRELWGTFFPVDVSQGEDKEGGKKDTFQNKNSRNIKIIQ